MFKTESIRAALGLACLLVLGCENHELEKNFFKQPLANRVERLHQYSLADQYKIFRYGNDRMEPPLMELADPIAERGATAVPFLLERLNSNPDDITVRDVLLIFDTMDATKSYDVKSDTGLMTTLASRVAGMKDQAWQVNCSKMLQRIKGPS